MTSEEIEATIKRIQEYGEHGCENVSQVVMAFMSGEQHREFQDKLISLLRQADPKTYIELPKGADGEVINIGDVVKTGCRRGVVDEIVTRVWRDLSRDHMVYVLSDGERLYVSPDSITRYRPTVEDVLTEFSEHVLGRGCQWGSEASETIAEYADKLREVMDDE